MTNREYYKEQILDLACACKTIAVTKDDKLVSCGSISCSDCSFHHTSMHCDQYAKRWSNEEYKESEIIIDWRKVPVDTPIYVDDRARYFAKYEGKEVYYYPDGKTSFTHSNNDDLYCADADDVHLARIEDIEKYRFN